MPQDRAQASGSSLCGGGSPHGLVEEATEDASEILVARWDASRAGARAGRGFHFQDAVGAWLGAKIAAGELQNVMLVPEGLDDLWLEGPEPVHVQVKSRLDRVGRFSAVAAAMHVLDSWERHADHDPQLARRLVVVLERGVQGEPNLHELHRSLEDVLVDGSALRTAIEQGAHARELDRTSIEALLTSTSVLAISWPQLTTETIDALRSLATVPNSALEYAARDLRIQVANAADANAAADYDRRVSLDRTGIVGEFERMVEHIDLDALESAIVEGVCESLDLRQPAEPDDRFYEGVSTQPGHVAAGLVVPRPELVAAALSGLDAQSAAVLTGPSGVGKSAVLWTVPLALPGVLWFRVRRLATADVPALIRLARAYRVKPEAPVGLLVDAAGTADLSGWSQLRSEAAAVPGLLLLATARQEDLMALGDLTGCATIAVNLDESAATAIFEGLIRRRATTARHWREAFAQSRGLTMEFTFLLTRGRRLADVIRDQVRIRLEESRWTELNVLRLVSVADRWSAPLPAVKVAEACDVTMGELRRAIGRLAGEHLIAEQDGMLSGLHRLRSQAICQAVHEIPPPTLAETVCTVARLVPARALHGFIAQALRDEAGLDSSLIEAAAAEPENLDRLIGFLYGLGLADFYETAKTWRDVADQHSVPRSSQPALLQFATAEVDFPDFFPESIRAARREMSVGPDRGRRGILIDRIGVSALARRLHAIGDVPKATVLLSSIGLSGSHLTDAVNEVVSDDSWLVQALCDAPPQEFSDFLAAARECDWRLAELLVESIGGQASILQRLRENNPWLTELDVRTVDSVPVAFARILHISDDLQGDPDQRAVALARTLLRCVPGVDSVDVQTLLPGGHEIVLGDHTHGVSRLQRRYDRSALNVAWNQARMRVVHTLLGDTDTNRLATALPLLKDAGQLIRESGTTLVTGRGINFRPRDLASAVEGLRSAAGLIKPSLGSVDLGDTDIGEQAAVPVANDVSALLIDVADTCVRLGNRDGYPALAAYMSDTVIGKHLQGAYDEPWHLIGIEKHPESLDDLGRLLSDLHAIVDELSHPDGDSARVVRAARSGKATSAFKRACEACRRFSRKRSERNREAIATKCASTGFQCSVLASNVDEGRTSFAVTVEVESLLQWYEGAERLRVALSGNWDQWGTLTLIPLRKGRPVPEVAMKLIINIWPISELGDWKSQLPEPHPGSLLSSFDQAHHALQAISGVLELPENQQEHEDVTQLVETAVSDFQAALNRIRQLPSDLVIDELLAVLDEHFRQVTDEIESNRPQPRLAEEVVKGTLGIVTTDEFSVLLGSRVFALEWDIDPTGAVDLLRGAGQGSN